MSEPEMIDVWITKYALTTGIHMARGEVCINVKSNMILVRDNRLGWTYFHAPFWHRTEAAALDHFGELIAAKRKSIAKSLAKLDQLASRVASGDVKIGEWGK